VIDIDPAVSKQKTKSTKQPPKQLLKPSSVVAINPPHILQRVLEDWKY